MSISGNKLCLLCASRLGSKRAKTNKGKRIRESVIGRKSARKRSKKAQIPRHEKEGLLVVTCATRRRRERRQRRPRRRSLLYKLSSCLCLRLSSFSAHPSSAVCEQLSRGIRAERVMSLFASLAHSSVARVALSPRRSREDSPGTVIRARDETR